MQPGGFWIDLKSLLEGSSSFVCETKVLISKGKIIEDLIFEIRRNFKTFLEAFDFKFIIVHVVKDIRNAELINCVTWLSIRGLSEE